MTGGLCRMFALLALALALLPAIASAAVDEDDLLPVDDAFALAASAPQRDRIELTWTIAKGYYLYRHRFDVQPSDGAFEVTALQLPPGEKHTDEFFGEVETYRDRIGAVITGTAATNASRVTLKVKYQGCADLGVCYPPQTRTIVVALPQKRQDVGDGLAALGRQLGPGSAAPLAGLARGANEPLPLPPEQAFGFEAIADDGNTLLLRFTPARGYYLYRDRTRFELVRARGTQNKGSAIALGTPRWPTGVSHHDEHFGDVIVYFDRIDVPLPLQRTRPEAETVTLSATFQGCQNEGICYPPMTRTVRLAVPAGRVDGNVSAFARTASTAAADMTSPALKDRDGRQRQAPLAAVAPAAVDALAATSPGIAQGDPPGQAEDSRIASALAGGSRWWTLLGFFGAGLLLAFTPCVLPMIPILSGLIAGQGTRIGTRRALVLSLVYIVANALVFTMAGVVAGLVGANLQTAFQTPWVIVAFSLLFVALALSSFGLYELQLPAAVRARLGSVSDKQRGGSLPGVAAMGALSALIVGPCVAPPLAAAVLYIGQSHDPVLGGAALFLLAMGMGVPLLAFGAAAGRGMPTSGPWMTVAQRIFGFVFLALSVWMLSRILQAPVSLGLYGLLALAAAAWAFSATGGNHRVRLLARFAGLALALVGAAELLGALGGGRDPLQPLAGILRGGDEIVELPFRKIKSMQDLDRELVAARGQGKPVLFDFYADWCVSCKEMEKYTFTEPAVHAALADFVLLKADVTANDDVDQALMRRFGIIGPPATLYFLDGRERRELRLIGFEKAEAFVARAQRAGAN